jgi:hypothetical protein
MLMSESILIFTGMQCRTSARTRTSPHQRKTPVILSQPSKFVAPWAQQTTKTRVEWTCISARLAEIFFRKAPLQPVTCNLTGDPA